MSKGFTFAVISDVHSNLEALQTVFEDIKKREIRNILFLGDVVGYGPDPSACIEIIRKNCKVALAGNHDWATIDLTPTEYFNYDAKIAVEWTRQQITNSDIEFLETLELVRILERENLFLVHATPMEPEQWKYLLTLYDAETNFQHFEQRICLIGHSHRPIIIERLPSGEMILHRERVTFSDSCRYIINVGSVGQPRDGDPRAAYAMVSDTEVEIVRLEYDFKRTQAKMLRAGLPEFLIERLEKGV